MDRGLKVIILPLVPTVLNQLRNKHKIQGVEGKTSGFVRVVLPWMAQLLDPRPN